LGQWASHSTRTPGSSCWATAWGPRPALGSPMPSAPVDRMTPSCRQRFADIPGLRQALELDSWHTPELHPLVLPVLPCAHLTPCTTPPYICYHQSNGLYLWHDMVPRRTQVVTGLGGGLNILAAVLLIVFRRSWSMLFTIDPVIIDRLDPVIIWLGLSLIGARL